MTSQQNLKYLSSGFSLTEVMVGMVISLISIIIILQVFTNFEGQKRTTSNGSDAQSNAAFALYTVERDVRMAGYGFSDPSLLGCSLNMSFNGSLITPAPKLAPITITQGVSGKPDTIAILSSAKDGWSVPARIVTNHPPQAANFFLNTTLGIAANDIMIAFEPGKPCTVIQVTGIPNGNTQVLHQSTSPWNPPYAFRV